MLIGTPPLLLSRSLGAMLSSNTLAFSDLVADQSSEGKKGKPIPGICVISSHITVPSMVEGSNATITTKLYLLSSD